MISIEENMLKELDKQAQEKFMTRSAYIQHMTLIHQNMKAGMPSTSRESNPTQTIEQTY